MLFPSWVGKRLPGIHPAQRAPRTPQSFLLLLLLAEPCPADSLGDSQSAQAQVSPGIAPPPPHFLLLELRAGHRSGPRFKSCFPVACKQNGRDFPLLRQTFGIVRGPRHSPAPARFCSAPLRSALPDFPRVAARNQAAVRSGSCELLVSSPTDLPGGRRIAVGDMAGTTTVKVEGTEVALGESGGTVVNITLNQESGMAYLCKGAASLIHRRTAAKDATGAARRPRRGEQKALGVAQILLGAVCIGIGVALSMIDRNGVIPSHYKQAVYNGVPFWSGSLFILSGTFSTVGAQHGGNWVHLATFLNLGSVVAGSVAYTVGLTDLPSPAYQPYFIERLCKNQAEYQHYRSWEQASSPSYDTRREQERTRECQEALMAFVVMWSSTQILLLILHSVALALALFCFGYGLHRLCCSCWGGWREYMAMEDADASEELGKELNPA